MGYNKTTWVDEVLDGAAEYSISGLTSPRTIELATTVTQAGTDLNANNLNNLESGVELANEVLPDTGTANNLAVDIGDNTVTDLKMSVKVAANNTGATTIDVTEGGVTNTYTIKKNITSDLDSDDIAAGEVIKLAYDGTNFQLIKNFSGSVDLSSIEYEIANLKLYQDASRRYEGTDLTLFGIDSTASLETTNDTTEVLTTEAVTTSDNTVDVDQPVNWVGGDEVTINGNEINTLSTVNNTIGDVSLASYTNDSFFIGNQEATARGFQLNSDGDKLFVVGSGQDRVYQYTLSEPNNIKTASYDNKSFSFFSEDNDVFGIHLNSDISKMWIIGNNTDTIYQYTLSTPGDISTASYDNKSFSVGTQEISTQGIHLSSDESKMWIVGSNTDSVYQYTLSTSGDISTASYDNKSFSVSAQDSAPVGIHLSSDESKMWIVGTSSDSVHQYTLSTPGDISTASYDSKSIDISSEDFSPVALDFNSDNSKMWVAGTNNDTIFQYEVGSSTLTFVNNFAANYSSGTPIYRSVDESIEDGTTQNMRLEIDTLGDKDTIATAINVDSGLTVDSAEVSIVDSANNESYVSLAEDSLVTKSDGSKEYDFSGSVGTAEDKITVKYNISNASGSSANVIKVLGSVK